MRSFRIFQCSIPRKYYRSHYQGQRCLRSRHLSLRSLSSLALTRRVVTFSKLSDDKPHRVEQIFDNLLGIYIFVDMLVARECCNDIVTEWQGVQEDNMGWASPFHALDSTAVVTPSIPTVAKALGVLQARDNLICYTEQSHSLLWVSINHHDNGLTRIFHQNVLRHHAIRTQSMLTRTDTPVEPVQYRGEQFCVLLRQMCAFHKHDNQEEQQGCRKQVRVTGEGRRIGVV